MQETLETEAGQGERREAGRKETEARRKKPLLWLINNVFLFLSAGLALLLAWRSGVLGSVGQMVFCLFLALLLILLSLWRIRSRQVRANVRRRRVTMITASVLSFLLLILPSGAAVFSYEASFGRHFDSDEIYDRPPASFPGLELRETSFLSNKGQKLAAYIYTHEKSEPDGLVIMAHGLGGGQKDSIEEAYYFIRQGLAVLAYDASGSDKSPGVLGGFPQAAIDLKYALRFAAETAGLKELPVFLYGHSMGAYAVNAVLAEPEAASVRAVCSLAGPNSSLAVIEAVGRDMFGAGMKLLLPYFSLYEYAKFGRAAEASALQGFAAGRAKVLLVQCADDKTVPPEVGYDIFYRRYKDDPRFEFILYPKGGHNIFLYSPAALSYRNRFNAAFNAYVDQLPDGLTRELKADYIKQKLDKQLAYETDPELFGRIYAFFISALHP